MEEGGEYYEENEKCGPCSRGGGLLLLVLGLGLGYMGADLLTGGALTRLVTGGLSAGIGAAAAAPPAPAGDNQEDLYDDGAGTGDGDGGASAEAVASAAGSTAG